MPSVSQTQQTILIDADDTLWQNNVYFERAIASFISFLDHATHTPEAIRRHLDAVERRTIAERGYGTESFRISLVRCFEEIAKSSLTDAQHARITRFVDAITSAKLELIDGVEQALITLSRDHRLILMTKGNRLEQLEKYDRSGLKPLFTAAEVVREKSCAAYLDVGHRFGCDPRRTWMIGNSPRSDINPALEAGFHAIYIPHPSTWVLEHEELAAPRANQHLFVLERLNQVENTLRALVNNSLIRP